MENSMAEVHQHGYLIQDRKFTLSIYFERAEPSSTYGAAGSIVLILLWVSYSCMILFFGAEFTQAYVRRYGHTTEPSSYALPQDDCESKKENKNCKKRAG
jgi:membrane protein